MELLKDEGIGTEEKLKPYLERAGNASSVKWRAARVRMEYLLTPVKKEEKAEEGDKEKKGAEAFWENKREGGKKEGEQKDGDQQGDGKQGGGQSAAGQQTWEKSGADSKSSEKQGADKSVVGKADGGQRSDEKGKSGGDKGGGSKADGGTDAKAKTAGVDGGKEAKK
jgi:hypothetical protein